LFRDDMLAPPILVLDTTRGHVNTASNHKSKNLKRAKGEIRKFLEYATRRIALPLPCFSRER